MKSILIAISFFLFSCQASTEHTAEITQLQNEVSLLRHQMDSLLYKPVGFTEPVRTAVKSKKKKRADRLVATDPAPVTTSTAAYSGTNRSSSKSSGYSGQCQAITKKGYQCSRKARSGGYCWQHGG